MLDERAPLLGLRRNLGLGRLRVEALTRARLRPFGDECLGHEAVEVAAKLLALGLRTGANPAGDGRVPGAVEVAGASSRDDQPVGRRPRQRIALELFRAPPPAWRCMRPFARSPSAIPRRATACSAHHSSSLSNSAVGSRSRAVGRHGREHLRGRARLIFEKQRSADANLPLDDFLRRKTRVGSTKRESARARARSSGSFFCRNRSRRARAAMSVAEGAADRLVLRDRRRRDRLVELPRVVQRARPLEIALRRGSRGAATRATRRLPHFYSCTRVALHPSPLNCCRHRSDRRSCRGPTPLRGRRGRGPAPRRRCDSPGG